MMYRWYQGWVFWAATSLSPQLAFAAPHIVQGRVVDEDSGEAIADVRVRVLGSGQVAHTDLQGRFSIGVERWPAVIVAQSEAIRTARAVVEEAQEQGPELVIRATYSEDHSIMVVAERVAPLTASTRTVNAREFRAVPRRTAEDALQLVPGFTLVQHGSEGKGHQFFLRGFDAIHGSDLELTVEGVPINEWSNIHAQGYLDVAFVIPETIQSVEVVKGPFTLSQGAFAMAGSANYELGIAPQERGLRLSYGFGSTLRHRGLLSYSPKDGDGKDFTAVELVRDRGFGENRGISRVSALGRWRMFRSDRWGVLSLLSSAYSAQFELPGTLRNEDYLEKKVGFYDSYDSAAAGRSQRALLSLQHRLFRRRHQFRTQLSGMVRRLEILQNYTGFLIDPVNGDRREQKQDSASINASAEYEYAVTSGLGVLASLSGRSDWIDQAQAHVDMLAKMMDQERSLKIAQSILSGSLGLRYRFKNRFWVSGGVRTDVVMIDIEDRLEEDPAFRQNDGLRATVSPRLSAEYKLSSPFRVFAAYGRGFRPPEARSFSSFVPKKKGITDDVINRGKPVNVSDDAVELGLRWMPNRYFAATTAAFGTLLRRETVFDHVSGVNLELSGTRRIGGEIEVHSHPIDSLTLSADLTYVDARFFESGKKIPLAPWLTGSAKAIFTHRSGFRAGLYFMAIAPRPLPHKARGGSLAVVDLSAGYSWRWLHLDLELENLLNNKVREGEYHYASHWERGAPPSEIPVLHYVAGAPLNARLSLSAVF